MHIIMAHLAQVDRYFIYHFEPVVFWTRAPIAKVLLRLLIFIFSPILDMFRYHVLAQLRDKGKLIFI
jgi:hypothetical protein